MQAGRLDVPVIADLAGFAAKLRTEVETAAEGLAAKIKVEIDGKGLRRRLKDVVKEASKGVTSTVKVKVDEERFRAELDGIRRRLDDAGLRVPVRTDGDGDSSRRGGLLGGLRDLISGAQGEADRTPVNVPVRMNLPGGGRGSLRMLGIGAIVSLLQPAVALIGQYGAGLTALVSAAAPAVGVLGAIPGLITAAGTAAISTKVAFAGFGEALKQSLKAQQQLADGSKLTKAEQQKLDQAVGNLSKSAQKSVRTVTELSGAWKDVRKSVQERFFSRIAGEIKPLSNAVLPLFKGALSSTSDAMGLLAQRGAKAMQSGPFKAGFQKVATTNARLMGNMSDGVSNLAVAAGHFLVAAGPFTERVGRAGERFTQYVRSSAQAGRETGSLATFLDHAGDKAAQLGRTTGSLIHGLGGVGKAAMETGNALLDGLEGSALRFERWAKSGVGQRAMKDFFSDAEPAFHEVNLLFGDLMRGMGRSMKDGGITDLVRQIRVELVPALGTFFNALGKDVGPAVISVISNIATAIGHVSEAGSGLGVLLVAFSGLLNIFNSLMSVVPGANTALAVLLGTMLALKVVTAVGNALRSFGTSVAAAGTSVRGLGTTMAGTTTAAGGHLSLWGRMSGVYSRVSQQGNRLTGTLRGIGAANAVASRAIGGITSALGGPLGIAIAGVTIGLGLLASKQEAAARAAQAHKERVKSLTDALTDSGGAIDANVRAQAYQVLKNTELADGQGNLIDVMKEAGVGVGTLTDAYLEQGGSVGGLQKDLMKLAEANKEYVEHGRDMYVLDYTDQGKKYKAAADALGGLNGNIKESKKNADEQREALEGAGNAGATSFDRLKSSMTLFNAETGTADQRVTALKSALDALSGNTESVHDATAQMNQAILGAKDAMGQEIAKTEGWGKALIDASGQVDTSTKNGLAFNSQLQSIRDGMLGVVASAKQAESDGFMTMSQAMYTSSQAASRSRQSVLDLAAAYGIPKAEAKQLADQLGLVPDVIESTVSLKGGDAVDVEVASIIGRLSSMKDKTIRVTAPSDAARAQLEALGITVQRVPGTKDLVLTAKTKTARDNLAAVKSDMNSVPGGKKLTVDAVVKKATGDLKGVQSSVKNLKGKSVEIKAPTKTAQAALKDLGFKIKDVDKGGKRVKITVPTGSPKANVAAIQGAIDRLKGKTVNVVVNWSAKGKGAALSKADGGIIQYANGGIRRAASRVQAFANGAENHIAQIGRPGDLRIWNEPETQGEAYLPLAKAKRQRSEEILDWVARYFGGMVVYPGRALQQYANGGVRSTSPASSSRTATTQQATAALVGGDLNLTMTSQPTTPGEALNDALFELRRMRRGGVYV
nr:hypothetical protein [Streptomyces sp. SID8379]